MQSPHSTRVELPGNIVHTVRFGTTLGQDRLEKISDIRHRKRGAAYSQSCSLKNGQQRSGCVVHHSQVLFNSRYPMKLSLFCLGNTAAVVMVGSAGTAVERCHKAEAESTTIRNRPNIFATDFRLPVGNHMG